MKNVENFCHITKKILHNMTEGDGAMDKLGHRKTRRFDGGWNKKATRRVDNRKKKRASNNLYGRRVRMSSFEIIMHWVFCASSLFLVYLIFS